MQTVKRWSIAVAAAGLLLAATAGAFAQSEHEGHYPPEEATAPAAPAPQPDGAARMQKEGMGCMMGGKGMPMMKMMEEMHGKMMVGTMAIQPQGDTGPASQAFNGIIAKMNQDMTLPFSGNADVDFAKRMIAERRAAVDMAKVALAFGKDPEIKTVAEGVIQANEADIAKIAAWLKKLGQ